MPALSSMPAKTSMPMLNGRPDYALIDALKNLSIIGALFMIMGYGRATRSAETAYGDV